MEEETNGPQLLISSEFEDVDTQMFQDNWIFWVEGVLVPVVGTLGVSGNVLSVILLTKQELDLKKSFRNLLIMLCVFDLLFVICMNLFYTLPVHFRVYNDEMIPYLTPFLLPLIHITLTGSVYSIMAVAGERYCIICKQWMSQSDGKGCIFSIILFSLLFNVNKFFEVTFEYVTYPVETYDNFSNSYVFINVTRPIVTITSLRNNQNYTTAIVFVNFVVMVLFPLVFLSICHYFTYRTCKKNTTRHNEITTHQRRDNALATLFLIIIVFFIFCHTGKFILNFYEVITIISGHKDDEWPMWTFVITRLNHILLVLNSSINFFIYCFRDRKFREALTSVICIEAVLKYFTSYSQTNHDRASPRPTTEVLLIPRKPANDEENIEPDNIESVV